jgi:hypothetical protein
MPETNTWPRKISGGIRTPARERAEHAVNAFFRLFRMPLKTGESREAAHL